jgi:hypothetical protein
VSDGTFRGRWVDEVFRSPLISDAVRVALLALVPDMDDAGCVSVAREDLAERIGRGKARITERLQSAVDAGLLERTAAGRRGQVAEYVASLPIGSAYPDPNETEQGPPIRTQSSAQLGLQSGPKVNTFGPDERTPSADKGSAYPDPLYRGVVDVSDQVDEITTDGGLFDKPAAAQQAAKPKRKRSPSLKTTIPADFALTDDMRQWAAENAPDVDISLQTQLFVNYFLDKGTKRPGWRRSWDSWMLRAQSWSADRNDNVRQLRPTGTDGNATRGGQRNLPDPSEYGKGNLRI